MICKITAIRCQLPDFALEQIEKNLNKLVRLLAEFMPDLPLLSIVIRHHRQRDYPPKHPGISRHTGIMDYFEGSMVLHLPKAPLAAHFHGRTIEEGLGVGFDWLSNELERYRELHLSSDSDYPDQSTIRKETKIFDIQIVQR